jgi:hypothetical protein
MIGRTIVVVHVFNYRISSGNFATPHARSLNVSYKRRYMKRAIHYITNREQGSRFHIPLLYDVDLKLTNLAVKSRLVHKF